MAKPRSTKPAGEPQGAVNMKALETALNLVSEEAGVPAQQIVPEMTTVYNSSQQERDMSLAGRLRDAEIRSKKVGMQYKAEQTRQVILAPSYQKYFGRVMTVSINGSFIAIPVNGAPFALPETFATEVDRRRQMADKMEKRAMACADVTFNGETSPGELPLIAR